MHPWIFCAIYNQITFNRSKLLALQSQGEKFLLIFDLAVYALLYSSFKVGERVLVVRKDVNV